MEKFEKKITEPLNPKLGENGECRPLEQIMWVKWL
jgi:hypothetical protein